MRAQHLKGREPVSAQGFNHICSLQWQNRGFSLALQSFIRKTLTLDSIMHSLDALSPFISSVFIFISCVSMWFPSPCPAPPASEQSSSRCHAQGLLHHHLSAPANTRQVPLHLQPAGPVQGLSGLADGRSLLHSGT